MLGLAPGVQLRCGWKGLFKPFGIPSILGDGFEKLSSVNIGHFFDGLISAVVLAGYGIGPVPKLSRTRPNRLFQLCQLRDVYCILAMMFLTENNSERREAKRFPIERELRYRLLGRNKEGRGTSVNISSSGILFATDDYVEPGTSIEVTVSWPVLSDADLPLGLVALGRVVRSEKGRVAIGFQRQQLCKLSAEAAQHDLMSVSGFTERS